MTSTDLAREVEDQLIATAERWTHPMNWSVCSVTSQRHQRLGR